MDCRLVLADIDGTLVNDNNELLDSTEKTIQDIIKSGIKFATVSARTISYTNAALGNLKDICCAKAYVNGAYIETTEGEVLVDKPIKAEEVDSIIKMLNDMKASFCCVSKDDAMAKLRDAKCSRGFLQHHGKLNERDIFDSSGRSIYLMPVEGRNLEKVIKYATMQGMDVETTPVIKSPKTDFEVTFFQRKGTNKEKALISIAEFLDVKLSDTMAFGDSILNDGPLIRTAGLGIAMNNSHEALKGMAQHVTEKDNNNDGVGTFLRKELLGR